MADLPQNPVYQQNSPTTGSLVGRLGSLSALKKIPVSNVRQPVSPNSFTNIQSMLEKAPGVPTGEPIAPQPMGNVPVPSNYPGFISGRTPAGFQWPQANPDTTSLRSSNAFEGQMAVDTSNPGKIVKSGRGLTSAEKQLILAGRPGDLYEVDHIVPLWAGGADTNANLHVLARPDHDKKTKAESVAYTLLANKKINESQARFYAMTWKDRDLTDIPSLDQYGLLPVDVALSVKNKWDAQAAAPVKLWDWKNPGKSVKAFFDAVPEATENLGTNLRESLGIQKPIMPENPVVSTGLGMAEELVKGIASGLTAGWIPYKPNQGDNIAEVGSGIVGNIAGAMIPISAFAKGIGLGVRGTSALARAGGAAKALGVGAETAEGVSTMIKLPSAAKSAMRALAFNNIASGTGAIVAYGQLTPEAINDRLGRFYTDLAYGIATPMAGRAFASGLGRAGAPVSNLAVQTSAEALGVGTAAAAISLMADPEHPTNALVNAGIMAALHGTLAPLGRGQAEEFKHNVEVEVQRMANNVLHTYIPERLPLLKSTEPVPAPKPQDQIINLRAEAMKRLDDLNAQGAISPEDYIRERSSIFVASSALEKPSLPVESLNNSNLVDLLSLARQSSRLKGQAITPPADLPKMSRVIDDKLFQQSYAYMDKEPQSGQNPTGIIRLSGMASGQNPYPELVREFFKKLSQGQASPSILLVDRPELAPVWKGVNNTILQSEVAARTKAPFKNPQNAVQAFGIMVDENGERTMVQLGWLPRRFHIEEEGSINSFNNAIKKTGPNRGGPTDPFYHQPDMNKDTIANGMKQKGLSFMVANLRPERSGLEAVGSKQPYINISVNDENWAKSVALNDMFRGKTAGESSKSVPQMVSEVNTALNVKNKQAQIKTIRENITEPSDVLLESPSAEVLRREAAGEVGAFQELLGNARDSLMQESPQAMAAKLKQYFGMDLPEQKTVEIFGARNSYTVRDLFRLLSQDGNGPVKQLISDTIKPFLESPLFRRGWEYGKTFPDLRILGGMKTPQNSTVAPVSAQEAVSNVPAVKTPQEANMGQIQPSTEAIQPVAQQTPPVQPELPLSKSVENPLATRLVSQAKAMPLDQNKTKAVSTSPTMVKTPAQQPAAQQLPLTSQAVAPAPMQEQAPMYSKNIEQTPASAKKKYASDMVRVFTESAREFEQRGSDLIESAVVPDKRNQYVQTLGSIIKSLDPAGQIPTATGSRKFTADERRVIRDRIQPRLRMKAEQLVEQAFDIDNEINFKTGGGGGSGDLHEAMKAVVKADTMKGLGDPEGAAALLQIYAKEDVERAMDVLGMKGLSGLLNKAEKAEKKPLEPLPPATKEDFDALNKVREDEGKARLSAIETGLQSKEDPYMYGWAKAMDEGLTKIFGNYKTPQNLRLLGSVFTDAGLRGSKTRQFENIFKTIKTEGNLQEISHTKDYLLALGSGDVNAIEASKTQRAAQLSEATPGGVMPDSLKTMSGDSVLESSDLKGGGMHLLSTTQDMNQVSGLSKVWTDIYPGLNAAMVSGAEPNAQQGVRDARAQIQFLMKVINERVTTNRSKYGSKSQFVSLGMMKGLGKQPYKTLSEKDRRAYQEENKMRTQGFFKDILDKVNKDLETPAE